jgi:hypothetical protein
LQIKEKQMKRLCIAVVMSAVSLLAQGPAQQRVTKLVTVKYADPNGLYNLVRMFGVEVQVNGPMKVLAISGSTDSVAAAETAIRQLDIAPKNIELTVHFVVGSDQANLAGNAVPQDLRDVIAQLKSTFAFKEYRMLDVLTLRTRSGSPAETSGILSTAAAPRLSVFSIRSATVSEDGGTVRIDRMHAGLRIPLINRAAAVAANLAPGHPDRLAAADGNLGKVEYRDTGIDQDVDVKEGQKVVVGRSSLEGPEKALFLILTARVIP